MTNSTACSSDLQLGEFIYEQPAVGDVEYIFKHALTQEVAYNSVLIERRSSCTSESARALEALYARSLDDHLAELAHHYGRSDNRRQGGRLPWPRSAAGAVSARPINEALAYAKRAGIALDYPRCRRRAERVQREFDLLYALARAAIAVERVWLAADDARLSADARTRARIGR